MLRIIDVPFYNLTIDREKDTGLAALSKYGNTFLDFKTEQCRITKWKTNGWREVKDGISGGTTEGTFTLLWKNGIHYATNSGVNDGNYQTGYYSVKNCLLNCINNVNNVDMKFECGYEDDDTSSYAYCANEINYHDDGSQLFISINHPMILMIGKAKDKIDDIKPEDFEIFLVPANLGVNIDAGVWHCSPFAYYTDKQVNMYTKQGKVHSKIYYYPIQEDQCIFRFPIVKS
jgi:hypothetical protein